MSMTDKKWEPGDVIVGRINKYVGRFVYRHGGWDEIDGPEPESGWGDHYIEDARRLAVVDYDSDEDIERLADVLTDLGGRFFGELRKEVLRNALRAFANPTPPIEEPTNVGAVVEAIYDNHFVRIDRGRKAWLRVGEIDPTVTCEWGEIAVTRVLSEGIPAEAKS